MVRRRGKNFAAPCFGMSVRRLDWCSVVPVSAYLASISLSVDSVDISNSKRHGVGVRMKLQMLPAMVIECAGHGSAAAAGRRKYLAVCQDAVDVGTQPVPDGMQRLDGHILETVGTSLHIAEDLVDTAPHRSQILTGSAVAPRVSPGSPPTAPSSQSKASPSRKNYGQRGED